MSLADWKSGAPSRLPLMEELVSAIVAPRRKRKVCGGWFDENDRPVPTLLQIQVRGHTLQAGSDHRWLKVNLSTEEDMQWFLGELWKDLHPAPGELLPLAAAEDQVAPVPEGDLLPQADPAEQVALVPGEAAPVPAEVAPVPGPEGLLALKLQSLESLQEAIQCCRARLLEHESVRNVT